jgi:hypothetical protein
MAVGGGKRGGTRSSRAAWSEEEKKSGKAMKQHTYLNDDDLALKKTLRTKEEGKGALLVL